MDEQLITELLQDIEEKVNTIHNAVQQIVTAKTNLELFEKRLQSWKEDYNTIIQKLKELERNQLSLAEYNKALSAVREDLTKTCGLLDNAGVRINELETAIAELDKKLTGTEEKLKDTVGEYAGLANRQQETERRLKDWAAETVQVRQGVSELKSELHQTGEQLNSRTASLEEKVKELSRDLKDISQQLADLKSQEIRDAPEQTNNDLEEITKRFQIYEGRLKKLEEAVMALRLEQKVEEAVAAALETPKKQILQVFEIVKRHHQQLQILANKMPNK